MANMRGRMTGSTAISGWENCHFMDEHMTITNLFSNNFRKIVNFLIFFAGRIRTPEA
jgi:hypothetical protein